MRYRDIAMLLLVFGMVAASVFGSYFFWEKTTERYKDKHDMATSKTLEDSYILENHELRMRLASITDFVNTMARDANVDEARGDLSMFEIKSVIERVVFDLGKKVQKLEHRLSVANSILSSNKAKQ